MKIIGIVAEYNPFHNGHYHQLHMLKQAHPDATIIVVMSGSFVQRGMPAFFSKFDRTRWALHGGADMVLELPTIYSLGSAEIFATGAVRLLSQLGATHISFGAENTDATLLKQIATAALSDEVQEHCRTFLQEGYAYGTALRLAITTAYPEAQDSIQEPNALLGIEYLRAIQTHHLQMEPLPILRTSAHHEAILSDELPSGTALRKLLSTITLASNKGQQTSMNSNLQDSLTPNIQELLSSYFPASICSDLETTLNKGEHLDGDRYDNLVHGINRTMTTTRLSALADFTEGIENRWLHAVNASNWQSVRASIKSKRYTYARIDRMASYTVFNLTKAILSKAHLEGPIYTRLLGFSHSGRELLKRWSKQDSPLPCEVIQKWAPVYQSAQGFKQQLMELDTQATDIQHLCFKTDASRLGGKDYLYSPYYYKG